MGSMALRLSDDLDKAMRDRAETAGVSYQQYVRDAVASRVDAEQTAERPAEPGSFDQDSLRRAREELELRHPGILGRSAAELASFAVDVEFDALSGFLADREDDR